MDISDHECTSRITDASIPSEVGNLSSVKAFYRKRSRLRGTFPTELFGLVSLEEFNFSEIANSLLPLLKRNYELMQFSFFAEYGVFKARYLMIESRYLSYFTFSSKSRTRSRMIVYHSKNHCLFDITFF